MYNISYECTINSGALMLTISVNTHVKLSLDARARSMLLSRPEVGCREPSAALVTPKKGQLFFPAEICRHSPWKSW